MCVLVRIENIESILFPHSTLQTFITMYFLVEQLFRFSIQYFGKTSISSEKLWKWRRGCNMKKNRDVYKQRATVFFFCGHCQNYLISKTKIRCFQAVRKSKKIKRYNYTNTFEISGYANSPIWYLFIWGTRKTLYSYGRINRLQNILFRTWVLWWNIYFAKKYRCF